MSSILFKNAGILATEGNGFKFIENGYLGVEGKIIDYIGTEEPKKRYKLILCSAGSLKALPTLMTALV